MYAYIYIYIYIHTYIHIHQGRGLGVPAPHEQRAASDGRSGRSSFMLNKMNGIVFILGFSMHYNMICCCGYEFWKIRRLHGGPRQRQAEPNVVYIYIYIYVYVYIDIMNSIV